MLAHPLKSRGFWKHQGELVQRSEGHDGIHPVSKHAHQHMMKYIHPSHLQ